MKTFQKLELKCDDCENECIIVIDNTDGEVMFCPFCGCNLEVVDEDDE